MPQILSIKAKVSADVPTQYGLKYKNSSTFLKNDNKIPKNKKRIINFSMVTILQICPKEAH